MLVCGETGRETSCIGRLLRSTGLLGGEITRDVKGFTTMSSVGEKTTRGSSIPLNPFFDFFLFLSQMTNRIQSMMAPRRLPTTAPIAAGGKPPRVLMPFP
jgi:hypothetical protein